MFKKCLIAIFSLLCSTSALANPASWSDIKQVVVIVFENTSAAQVMEQPYFKELAAEGALLAHSHGVVHPSQPNYLAMVGGDTFQAQDENITVDAKHLGNLLEAKNKDWRAYAEGYPAGTCFLDEKKGTYYRKHVPFLSFKNVSSDPKECAKVVPAAQFFTDLKEGKLPALSFYTPDINNDAHDTTVAYADRYFAKTFADTLKDPKVLANTLFIITFDEDDYKGDNSIYTVFLGAGIAKGKVVQKRYDHYDVLRTIEKIFGLGTLGKHDQKGKVIQGIWK